MSVLDTLLRKVKTGILDKTNLDERLVSAVRPKPQPIIRPLAQPKFNFTDVTKTPKYKALQTLERSQKFLQPFTDIGSQVIGQPVEAIAISRMSDAQRAKYQPKFIKAPTLKGQVGDVAKGSVNLASLVAGGGTKAGLKMLTGLGLLNTAIEGATADRKPNESMLEAGAKKTLQDLPRLTMRAGQYATGNKLVEPLVKGLPFVKKAAILGAENVAEDVATTKTGLTPDLTAKDSVASFLAPGVLEGSGKLIKNIFTKVPESIEKIGGQKVVDQMGDILKIVTNKGKTIYYDNSTKRIVTVPMVKKMVTRDVPFSVLGKQQPPIKLQSEVTEPAFGAAYGIEPEINEEGKLTGVKYDPVKGVVGVGVMGGVKEIRKGSLDDTLKSVKGAIKKAGNTLDPLIQEARKYKSADEFKQFARGDNIYYRGTRATNNAIGDNPVFVTKDGNMAITYSESYPNLDLAEKELQAFTLKDGKTLDLTDIEDAKKYLGMENNKEFTRGDIYGRWDSVIEKAKSEGYDYIKHSGESKFKTGTAEEIVVLNPKKALTSLTDIWNQANAKPAPKEVINNSETIGNIQQAEELSKILKLEEDLTKRIAENLNDLQGGKISTKTYATRHASIIKKLEDIQLLKDNISAGADQEIIRDSFNSVNPIKRAKRRSALDELGTTKSGGTVGEIQQKIQSPDLTAYEKAMNSNDSEALSNLAQKYPDDARFHVHETLDKLSDNMKTRDTLSLPKSQDVPSKLLSTGRLQLPTGEPIGTKPKNYIPRKRPTTVIQLPVGRKDPTANDLQPGLTDFDRRKRSELMRNKANMVFPLPKNTPLLQSPQEVITSKSKLLDIFKKTGEVRPFVNQIKSRRTKPIITPAPVTPVASTGSEARKIFSETGKMPEVQPQKTEGDGVILASGKTINERLDDFYEKVTGVRPETIEGGQRTAGWYTKTLRDMQGSVSTKIEDMLVSESPIVRNTAATMQGFFKGLAMSPQRAQESMSLRGGVAQSLNDGYSVMNNLYKLVDNKDSLRRVNDALDPELATEKISFADLTPQEKSLYKLVREGLDLVHDISYSNGHISKDIYLKNQGSYTPRAYDLYEMPEEVSKALGSKKIETGIYKAKTDINDWKQEHSLGDPVYTLGKRISQVEGNTVVKKYADFVASNAKYVSNEAKDGFTKLSDSPAYGNLKGKYVANFIAEDLKGYFFANENLQKVYDVFRDYDRLPIRQLQKKLLTVFNPTTNVGNIISNDIFAFMAGIDPYTFNRSMSEVLGDPKLKANYSRHLTKAGILGTDITRTDFTPSKAKFDGKEGITDKITKFYGSVDDNAKLGSFHALIKKGYTTDEATKLVSDTFQNYANVGKFYDVWAKTPVVGSAFIKFQGDLMRMIKNAAVNRPLHLMTFLGTLKLAATATSVMSGESLEDQKTREGRAFAPTIPGLNIPLVWQTPFGEINVARYISPMYANQSDSSSEVANKMLPFIPDISRDNEGNLDVPTSIARSADDPLLGGIVQTLVDRDFRGKSISDPDSNKYTGSLLTPEEKLKNKTSFVGRNYLPPVVNSLIDVKDAVAGEKDRYGRTRTPLQAILRAGGIKMEQFGAEEAQLARDKDAMYAQNAIEYKQRDISAIRNQLAKGLITEDQANTRINNIQKELNEMTSNLGKTGVAGTEAKVGTLPEARIKSLNNILGMDRVTSMPEGTNYEKAQKKAVQFDVIDKTLDSDFLTPEEQEAYLSQVTDLKKEEVGYYRVARGGTDERYGFILDKLETTDGDVMKILATMRYEIDEKKILTNNLIDRLEDEGYVSDSQAKLLKKLEYNQSTGKVINTSSGSTSNKLAKDIAKLNVDSAKGLQEIFEKLASSTSSKRGIGSILQITNQLNPRPSGASRNISDVLSSKRIIQPSAKIG